jgi:hypothetical protein
MFHPGFLFGLFDIEAGDDIFLRNVSCLLTNYTVYIPEDRTVFRRLHGTVKKFPCRNHAHECIIMLEDG